VNNPVKKIIIIKSFQEGQFAVTVSSGENEK
jgi:hypothetical protein